MALLFLLKSSKCRNTGPGSIHALITWGMFQLIEVTMARGVLSCPLARFVAGVNRLSAAES